MAASIERPVEWSPRNLARAIALLFLVTIVLGVISLIIGGLIAGGFWGFVIGVVIAVVLTAVYGRVMAGRTPRPI